MNYELTVQTELNHSGYQIINEDAPGFLKSYVFKDEYEANLAWAIWLQYSKDTIKNTRGIASANYNDYSWIMKAIFRVIGKESIWSE